MSERAPKVFISYSHDSPEHADRVLDLSNRLRGEGIDTVLDQLACRATLISATMDYFNGSAGCPVRWR